MAASILLHGPWSDRPARVVEVTMMARWRSRGALAAVSVALLLAWLRRAGGQAQPPVLLLSPASGPAGMMVQASGSGFAASTCAVNLALDAPTGAALGSAPVAGGAFTASITIPVGTPDGAHVVFAVGLALSGEFCTAPSGEEASADFLVGQPQPHFVGDPVTPAVFMGDLRDLPTVAPWQEGQPVFEAEGQDDEFAVGLSARAAARAMRRGKRLLRRHRHRRKRLAAPAPLVVNGVSFDAIPGTGIVPSDTTGDVGPHHFIQTVNVAFEVFDKQGTPLAGPSPINSLWAGFVGNCETHNSGDPDVRYDQLADRWIIMQFTLTRDPMTSRTDFCMAVSRTGDPVSGGWYLYDFPTGGISNDYPKLAVWPDAYYLGSQRGSSDAWAVDRVQMLAGAPATMQGFNDPGAFMLPADLDGPTPPPAGTPALFARIVDGSPDRLELRAFHVDFANPMSSTFTALPDLPTAPFDGTLAGIPQPGTSLTLETLTGWPMARLQYRNFGTHETLVFNHQVDADGMDHAGVRWYELRRAGGGWSIFQQGTHAPDLGAPGLADDVNRWFGSAAMDKLGSIALGYSVGNASVFPGLRRAGRLAGDPLGTMPQPETPIVDGGGAQLTMFQRWGDYSALLVDPVDDCTFWFTSEYMRTTSVAGWSTRIASFKLPGCNVPPVCDAGGPYVAECTGPTTAVTLDGTGSSDANGDALDFTWAGPFLGGSATGPQPLVQFPGTGAFGVTLTVSDGDASSTCTASATVQDTLPPSIVAPADVTVECTSPAGASPPLGTPVVSDVCDTSPMVTNDAPAVFPLGSTVVTWTATDHGGHTATDTQVVTVVDTTPPTLTLSVSPTTLWPPNHMLVSVQAAVAASDVCDPSPAIRLDAITSSEPANSTGDGNTAVDVAGAAFGTDDRSFELRAERQGGGPGRVYTIRYSATDAAMNTTTSQATVTVPANQGH
jgi:hypothetical protein